jgi:hypothetical protein
MKARPGDEYRHARAGISAEHGTHHMIDLIARQGDRHKRLVGLGRAVGHGATVGARADVRGTTRLTTQPRRPSRTRVGGAILAGIASGVPLRVG